MDLVGNEPDFLICIECETPVYTFEWDEGQARLHECLCPTCGNDQVGEFQTEDEFMGED
jgi:hypothetical protein